MKKNLIKKMVLKKVTVATLDAENLNALHGGKEADETFNYPCEEYTFAFHYCGGGPTEIYPCISICHTRCL